MTADDETGIPDGGGQAPGGNRGEVPARRSGAVEPHAYWPSYQHMGDCAVCGHVRDSPLHVEPPRIRRDLFDV